MPWAQGVAGSNPVAPTKIDRFGQQIEEDDVADSFRPVFEGLKEAAQHSMAASSEIDQAGAALVRVTDAALQAKDEHEDLPETVHRLESLIAQGQDLRALRERLDR